MPDREQDTPAVHAAHHHAGRIHVHHLGPYRLDGGTTGAMDVCHGHLEGKDLYQQPRCRIAV